MREQLREEVTPRRGTANRHKGKRVKKLIFILILHFFYFSLPTVTLLFLAKAMLCALLIIWLAQVIIMMIIMIIMIMSIWWSPHNMACTGDYDYRDMVIWWSDYNMACTGEEHIIDIRKDLSHLIIWLITYLYHIFIPSHFPVSLLTSSMCSPT